MTPAIRTIFYHASLSGAQLEVKNPAGWQDLAVSLERHDEYHTLIEYFKGNFLWYGNAMSTLKAIEAASGINTDVRVTFEISFKEGVWELIFEGLIKLAQLEEIFAADREAKLLAPVIRDDFWSKFINRIKQPVNLESTTDLDGGTRTAVNKTSVFMRSQLLRKRIQADRQASTPFIGATYSGNTTKYFIPTLQENQINEDVGDFFGIADEVTDNVPTTDRIHFLKLNAQSTGTWVFSNNMRLKVTVGNPQNGDTISADIIIVRRKVETGALTTHTTSIIPNTVLTNTPYDSGWLDFGLLQPSFNPTFTDCSAGDEFYFYFRVISNLAAIGGSTNRIEFDVAQLNRLYAQTDSLYPDSTTDAYLIKEAAESIVSKYVGQDAAVTSTKFSNSTFNRNAIFRGKHVRGYGFTAKPMQMSFEEWWNGANPMFNLCLGYTEISGVKKIFIEDKGYAYNPTVIVNLPEAGNLVRKYDLERYFKSVEIGYAKWSAESASGIDDPNTKQTRNTNLKAFGKDEKIVSQFLTAGLAIERSRRNRVELGKDDRLDEDIMLVSVIDDSGWKLEFNENFDAITNVLNSDKRANLRHTPMRVFRRWINYLAPSLGAAENFVFGKGEGNFDATTQLDPTDYEALTNPDAIIDEKGNFAAGTNRLWVPRIYELNDYSMSWETYKDIRENKNNAVGVSRGTSGFAPMFIINLDYQMFKGKANMTLLQATSTPI